MTKNRQLLIISGITGAIGNALLAKYAKMDNTIIYGISRKAENICNFINPSTNKLFASTMIFSLTKMDNKSYSDFIKLINFKEFSEIKYVHALGLYPFEINEKGERIIENDKDNDGINDACNFLTYNVFRFVTSNLIRNTNLPIKALIFGGLADEHKPLAHKSWWKTIEKVKKYMKSASNKKNKMFVLNISSVICSHEIITRPYSFIQTDANLKYWLSPEDVANKVIRILRDSKYSYSEQFLFYKNPGFEKDYYVDRKFTPRKISELFKESGKEVNLR